MQNSILIPTVYLSFNLHIDSHDTSFFIGFPRNALIGSQFGLVCGIPTPSLVESIEIKVVFGLVYGPIG